MLISNPTIVHTLTSERIRLMKWTKLAAVSAAASLTVMGGALPAVIDVATPLAGAQEASAANTHRQVQNGTMTWGVKESFRGYVVGNIAKGAIFVNGQEVASKQSGRSAAPFNFTATKSSLSSPTSGVIAFNESVRFTGHNYGNGPLLDLELSNIRLQFNGSSAELVVDYKTVEFKGMDTKAIPDPPRTGSDKVLATLSLSGADFSKDRVTVNGTNVTLTPFGREIFANFYDESRSDLDDLTATFSVSDAAGAPPAGPSISGGGGAGGGATRSNAKDGPAALLGTVNDTLTEINGLIVNSNNVLDNSEKLFRPRGAAAARGSGDSGTTASGAGATGGTAGGGAPFSAANVGPVATKSGSPVGGGAGAGGATGNTGGGASAPSGNAGAGGGNAGTAKTATTAAGGGSGSGDVCKDDGSRGVQSAKAAWGVRQSFRNYIRGTIAKGKWQLSGVGDTNNAFQWTGNSGAVNVNKKSGTILFPGTIRFTGHNGILDTQFSNMEIQFAGNSGQLILNVKSNDVEGNPHDYGRVVLANLAFSQLDVSEGSVSGTASTTLTAAGAEAFAQFYPTGDALDPISFTAQLGGKPNCAQGQGGSVSGAATGQGGSAAQAAALRSGESAGGESASAVTAADSGDSADGSVFDEQDGIDATSESKGTGTSKFNIKNGNADDGVTGGWDDSAIAQTIMMLASFLASGGVLARFAVRN